MTAALPSPHRRDVVRGAPAVPAIAEVAPDLSEGHGAIILDGKLVMFDTARFDMDPEDKAVVIQWDGSFAISGASNCEGHRFAGERSGLGTPKPNAYGGTNAEAVVILGKVTEIRAIRSRPVLVSSNEMGPH